MNTKKEYIKNFIIRIIKGKVDQTEIQQVRKNLMNYSREDWQDLKLLAKELAKEAIDEQIDKVDKMPNDWKELARDFSHSAVNLFLAIFNEEVFYQSMLLEKQAGLDQQTKMIKILPAISQSIDHIVSRTPSKSANISWKADKSLTAKVKKVVKEVKGMFYRQFWNGGYYNQEEIKSKMSKLIPIFESLTEEEIAVLKSKLKILATKLIDRYAPPQIKNSPEIRQIINSSINLINVLGDEKLFKDLINIVAKIAKSAIQNPQAFKGANFPTVLRITGTEGEVKNLIRNCTQHFNKLAAEGDKNNLSTEREESIIQRLTENNSNPQPNQEDTNLENILKDNLLTQGLSSGGNQMDLSNRDLWKIFEETYLNTQIKPKWYQNPWIIWPIAGVALVVGGLIIWWLVGRKKEKKTDGLSSG